MEQILSMQMLTVKFGNKLPALCSCWTNGIISSALYFGWSIICQILIDDVPQFTYNRHLLLYTRIVIILHFPTYSKQRTFAQIHFQFQTGIINHNWWWPKEANTPSKYSTHEPDQIKQNIPTLSQLVLIIFITTVTIQIYKQRPPYQ